VTCPILGLGALALIRLWPIHRIDIAVAVALGVFFLWAIYFYVLQDWPSEWVIGTMALVILIQGAVATLQFIQQRSLGLAFLGEPYRTPDMPGLCVIESGGQRWLRAYGLTPHPNVLGGYLSIGILICLGAILTTTGWYRRWLWICLIAGGMGLFFSFSRSAWLGTLTGLIYLLLLTRPWHHWRRLPATIRWRVLLGPIILTALMAALWVSFAPLLRARLLRLDTPLEKRSIEDRFTDVEQAWSLIRSAPLSGIGTGYYRDALQERAGNATAPGFRTVHNIPLLAAAEMGIGGALLWLALVLSVPIRQILQSRLLSRSGPDSANRAVAPLDAGTPSSAGSRPSSTLFLAQDFLRTSWAAAFVSATVVSMLDVYLYFPMTWWPALYLGILAGSWGRGGDRVQKEPIA
jgi:O-antigen ligase